MKITSAVIQGFLFLEGGTMRKSRLIQCMGISADELDASLDELARYLEGSGLALIRTDMEIALVLSAQTAAVIRQSYMEEGNKDIGEAGLEALAIVLYRGPSTRSQIDYVRGVNTASTIRNLLARGLLERTGNPEDGREYLYRPTPELLAYIGVREVNELPEYASISRDLASFEKYEREVQQPTDHEYNPNEYEA